MGIVPANARWWPPGGWPGLDGSSTRPAVQAGLRPLGGLRSLVPSPQLVALCYVAPGNNYP